MDNKGMVDTADIVDIDKVERNKWGIFVPLVNGFICSFQAGFV